MHGCLIYDRNPFTSLTGLHRWRPVEQPPPRDRARRSGNREINKESSTIIHNRPTLAVVQSFSPTTQQIEDPSPVKTVALKTSMTANPNSTASRIPREVNPNHPGWSRSQRILVDLTAEKGYPWSGFSSVNV